MGFIIRIAKAIFDFLDFIATVVGGWPVLGGLVSGALTATISAIQDLGPWTVIIALYAAVLGAIAIEYFQGLLRRWRRTSQAKIEKLRELYRLSIHGNGIAHFLSLPENQSGDCYNDLMLRLALWEREVSNALRDVGDFGEYFGFESLAFPQKREKLRLIIMRYANTHHIQTEDVLRDFQSHPARDATSSSVQM